MYTHCKSNDKVQKNAQKWEQVSEFIKVTKDKRRKKSTQQQQQQQRQHTQRTVKEISRII